MPREIEQRDRSALLSWKSQVLRSQLLSRCIVVMTMIVHGQSWITGLPCLIDCRARIEFQRGLKSATVETIFDVSSDLSRHARSITKPKSNDIHSAQSHASPALCILKQSKLADLIHRCKPETSRHLPLFISENLNENLS